MKRLVSLVLGLVLVALTGCSPVEQNARNVLAANYGLLTAAFQQYQGECSANPSNAPCTLILKDAQAQDVAITALETYCGFSSVSQIGDKCVPVKSAEAGLVSALANVAQLEAQIKALIQPVATPTPAPSTPATKTGGAL